MVQVQTGSDTCYIKFGAVKPGPDAENNFERLLEAGEVFAAEKGMTHLVAVLIQHVIMPIAKCC